MAGAGAIKAGEAYVEIGARIGPKFYAGMARIRQTLNRVGSGFLRLGRRAAIAGVAIAAAFVASTAYFVKAASVAEDTRDKFDMVFKEMTGATRAWAKAYAEEFGFAQSSVEGWMARMQDTFVPLGFARAEAADMGKTLVKLGADLASFNPAVRNTDEALTMMASALVGNHEAVRPLGIMIGEYELKQAGLTLGLVKGKQEMTNQQKVLARLHIIMKSSADAMDNLKKTGASTKNTMNRLSEAWKGLREKIGEVMQKDVTGWIGRLTLGLTKGQNILIGYVTKGWTALVSILEKVAQKFMELATNGKIDTWLTNMKNGFKGVAAMAQAVAITVRAAIAGLMSLFSIDARELQGQLLGQKKQRQELEDERRAWNIVKQGGVSALESQYERIGGNRTFDISKTGGERAREMAAIKSVKAQIATRSKSAERYKEKGIEMGPEWTSAKLQAQKRVEMIDRNLEGVAEQTAMLQGKTLSTSSELAKLPAVFDKLLDSVQDPITIVKDKIAPALSALGKTTQPSMVRGLGKAGRMLADGFVGRMQALKGRVVGLLGGIGGGAGAGAGPIGAYGGMSGIGALSGATTSQLNAATTGRMKMQGATESTQRRMADDIRRLATQPGRFFWNGVEVAQ